MVSNERKHILVVDDSELDMQFLVEALQEDFTISTAKNGQQALDSLSQGVKPSVVILDINMPEMSGYETCEAILAEDNDMDVIFISSANDSNDDVLKGYSKGAIDFISKPIDMALLKSKVFLALKNRETLNNLKKTNISANKLAMDAMTHTGELGAIIEYQRQCFLVDNIYDLCETLVEVVSQLGLNCCVQVNEGDKVATHSDTGVVNALEAQLMDRTSSLEERFFTSKMRTFVCYEDIIILIKNMPIEDEEKTGRLRDVLLIIAESAQSRINSFALMRKSSNTLSSSNNIKSSDELRKKIVNLVDYVENIYDSFEKDKIKYANKSVILANTIVNKLEEAFCSLDLTEPQEQALLQAVEDVIDSSIKPHESDVQLDHQLKNIANQLTSLQIMP